MQVDVMMRINLELDGLPSDADDEEIRNSIIYNLWCLIDIDDYSYEEISDRLSLFWRPVSS